MTDNTIVPVSAEDAPTYLADIDPVLRRLEAVTARLIRARCVFSGDEMPAAEFVAHFEALIHTADDSGNALLEIANELLAAKARLAGLPPLTP